ncbi:MAG: saccharopine dehydrogenase C-terminal domain-containing protein [Polyangia bacterium]|jgi:saccharopine dehydrogenase-like NADP-dependent oxidoreductase|nr:saccharopine dehydrogenase C-terminal domain-containing protein [Polyangia bacterium]
MTTTKSGKKVLLLGAGMVTRPGVSYMLEHGCEVLVASRTVKKAASLVEGHPNGRAVAFTIDDREALNRLASESDVVISLLPAPMHPVVAEACLAAGTNLVTTSYVSPAMRDLDERARQKGLLFLNEIGLDPGIDHMSAMKVINGVRAQGGTVTSFRSYCGGLPAPDSNTNPWGYKFSWSPMAVLRAGLNPARYLEDGRLLEIPGPELFAHHWPMKVPGAPDFEGYPNRDSMGYVELYGLESARTMFRGTLRYPGWCATLKLVVDLGLLDQTPREDLSGRTHAEVLASLVPGAKPSTVRADIAARFDLTPEADPLERLAWAGFFSELPVPQVGSLMELVGARLQEKLTLGPGERDMIALHHEFEAELPGGIKKRIQSTMVDFGVPDGDSAMARTVSLPCAVATRLLLEGKIALRGVQIPVQPELYEPVLAELEPLGIRCEERETTL